MSIPAEVQGQMGRGCRAAPQQREPPRAAIRHGGDAEPGKLGGETQSVMLYIRVLYEAITMESGCFAFHRKRTHLIK